MNVGLSGSDGGLFGSQIAGCVVHFLLGYAIGLDEVPVATGSDVREIGVGLRGFEIGFRLNELLIDFRRVDFGKELALLDARTDIAVPLFEIAVGASVNGRLDVSLHGAGQNEPYLGGVCGRVNPGE